MLVAAILIPLLALALLGLVNWLVPKEERARILGMLLAGYFLRLFLFQFVMRSVAFFSHGHAGGDSEIYERYGSMIAIIWRATGVHFVTESEFHSLGSVALPCNILALLEYVGGEPSPLGGTAINAFVACWTVVLFYRFVLDAGTEKRAAAFASLLLLFGPSFLYHTSDTYKDGLNAFFVIASLMNSIRLAQTFSWTRAAYLAGTLVALWFVRHYMVFMCCIPLVFGLLGSSKATATRRVVAGFLITGLAIGAIYTGAFSTVYGSAEATFTRATSDTVMRYNAELRGTGSGVVTDNYLVRLVYTLFAPFPWQVGSLGLQLGKIEALLFYFFMYRTWKHRRFLLGTHRTTLLMVGAFIVPATIAYAASMSNIGLVVRQRMPIVIAFAILAALTQTEERIRARSAPPRAPKKRPPLGSPTEQPTLARPLTTTPQAP